MNKAQKERLNADVGRRNELVEGSRILQEACMATEDAVQDAGDEEADHKKLHAILNKMNETKEVFETLFYELVPGAKPVEKTQDTEETTK